MRRIFVSTFFALCPVLGLFCAAVIGCRGTAVPDSAAEAEMAPQQVVRSFARYLGEKKWKRAYLLLSRDTRERYSPFQFRELFEKTIIGGLLYWQFATWDLVEIDLNVATGEGVFTLRHPVHKDHERKFRLILEPALRKQEDGTEKELKVWRLKFTIAELLNMPDEDEELLFPTN